MEKSLYKIAWILLAAGAGMFLFLKAIHFPPCLLYTFTGIYCPGCGGTRAVLALLHGHPLRSLYYHPFVPYCAVTGGWFLISQTIEILSCGRIPIGMKYKNIYVYTGIFIILANWLLKNLLPFEMI